jgi:hypothetical protein
MADGNSLTDLRGKVAADPSFRGLSVFFVIFIGRTSGCDRWITANL